MEKKYKWEQNSPRVSFMGVGGMNFLYHIGKSYFSYNPNPNNNIIDMMFGVDTGEETAFYNAKRDTFVILLETLERFDTKKEAVIEINKYLN